jgi:uroporphyrinogen decarboxylase
MTESGTRHQSGKGRFIDVLRYKNLDYVPHLQTLIESNHVDYFLDKKQGVDSWSLPPASHVELVKKCGIDFVFTSCYGRFGQLYQTAGEGGQYINGRLKTPEDFNSYPFKAERQRKMEYFDSFLKQLVRAAKEDGDVGVAVALRSVMSETYLSMGIEDFMIALYDNPIYVESLMDLYLDFTLKAIDIVAENGADLVLIDDDLADSNGFMIGASRTKELWYDRNMEITNKLRSKGIPYIGHCCGKIDELIPWLIEMGYLGIHPIQPDCNDIFELKKQYQGEISFIGNIDIDSILTSGSVDEVRADTAEHLERLSQGGGYVLCSSHTIVNHIPVRNFSEMCSVWNDFNKRKIK